jgi:hypothetical protein
VPPGITIQLASSANSDIALSKSRSLRAACRSESILLFSSIAKLLSSENCRVLRRREDFRLSMPMQTWQLGDRGLLGDSFPNRPRGSWRSHFGLCGSLGAHTHRKTTIQTRASAPRKPRNRITQFLKTIVVAPISGDLLVMHLRAETPSIGSELGTHG